MKSLEPILVAAFVSAAVCIVFPRESRGGDATWRGDFSCGKQGLSDAKVSLNAPVLGDETVLFSLPAGKSNLGQFSFASGRNLIAYFTGLREEARRVVFGFILEASDICLKKPDYVARGSGGHIKPEYLNPSDYAL